MRLHINLIVSLIIFLLIISAGSYAYHEVEEWNTLDSVYFVVVTVTTIGYGDLSPQTDTGKIFTIFFSFFGIATAFYFVSLIGTFVFKQHFRKRIKQIEKAVKKKAELKKKKKRKKRK